MPRHIGIAAVSPEGSALCYRSIMSRVEALEGERPTVTMHSLPFSSYMRAISAEDWQGVGRMLQDSSAALARAGAEFCVLPDNVAQHALQWAQAGSATPWLSMADQVAEAVLADGKHTVGLLGTRFVTRGSTYQTLLGIRGVKVVAPDDGDCAEIDRVIFEELVFGRVKPSSQTLLRDVVSRLLDRGSEGVIVACTELPLLAQGQDPLTTMYDSVELLADAAVRHAAATA